MSLKKSRSLQDLHFFRTAQPYKSQVGESALPLEVSSPALFHEKFSFSLKYLFLLFFFVFPLWHYLRLYPSRVKLWRPGAVISRSWVMGLVALCCPVLSMPMTCSCGLSCSSASRWRCSCGSTGRKHLQEQSWAASFIARWPWRYGRATWMTI